MAERHQNRTLWYLRRSHQTTRQTYPAARSNLPQEFHRQTHRLATERPRIQPLPRPDQTLLAHPYRHTAMAPLHLPLHQIHRTPTSPLLVNDTV